MFYENSITYCFQIDLTSEMHSKCLSLKCHAKAIRFFKTSERRLVSEMFQIQILQLKCIENCCLVNQSIVYYYWSYDSCEPINCLLLLKLRFLWTNQLSITTEVTNLVNQSIVYYYWSYDSLPCGETNSIQLCVIKLVSDLFPELYTTLCNKVSKWLVSWTLYNFV
jgi:hypothetical protein